MKAAGRVQSLPVERVRMTARRWRRVAPSPSLLKKKPPNDASCNILTGASQHYDAVCSLA